MEVCVVLGAGFVVGFFLFISDWVVVVLLFVLLLVYVAVAAVAEAAAAEEEEESDPDEDPDDPAVRLKKLNKMRKKGLITDEDYEVKKDEILAEM